MADEEDGDETASIEEYAGDGDQESTEISVDESSATSDSEIAKQAKEKAVEEKKSETENVKKEQLGTLQLMINDVVFDWYLMVPLCGIAIFYSIVMAMGVLELANNTGDSSCSFTATPLGKKNLSKTLTNADSIAESFIEENSINIGTTEQFITLGPTVESITNATEIIDFEALAQAALQMRVEVTETSPNVLNFAEEANSPDSDNDGIPDSLDGDADNDGWLDIDSDSDSIKDVFDDDDDNDGILDVDDPDMNNDGIPDTDTDEDGIPNHLDPDDDNDGIPDTMDTDDNGDGVEDVDTDGDGLLDWIDPDDDNDGILDEQENVWSEWSDYTVCNANVSCGTGIKLRTRNCTSPTGVLHNETVSNCVGQDTESVVCVGARDGSCPGCDEPINKHYGDVIVPMEASQLPGEQFLVFMHMGFARNSIINRFRFYSMKARDFYVGFWTVTNIEYSKKTRHSFLLHKKVLLSAAIGVNTVDANVRVDGGWFVGIHYPDNGSIPSQYGANGKGAVQVKTIQLNADDLYAASYFFSAVDTDWQEGHVQKATWHQTAIFVPALIIDYTCI